MCIKKFFFTRRIYSRTLGSALIFPISQSGTLNTLATVITAAVLNKTIILLIISAAVFGVLKKPFIRLYDLAIYFDCVPSYISQF